jgi:hypothetical protein
MNRRHLVKLRELSLSNRGCLREVIPWCHGVSFLNHFPLSMALIPGFS